MTISQCLLTSQPPCIQNTFAIKTYYMPTNMSKTQDAVKIAKAVGEKSASTHIQHIQLIYKHNTHESKWSPQMYKNIQHTR